MSYDDELARVLSDSVLLSVTDDCLLSGAVESSMVMGPQETPRQTLLLSATQFAPSFTASDTQLAAFTHRWWVPHLIDRYWRAFKLWTSH